MGRDDRHVPRLLISLLHLLGLLLGQGHWCSCQWADLGFFFYYYVVFLPLWRQKNACQRYMFIAVLEGRDHSFSL